MCSSACKKCQQKLQSGFGKLFEKWASFITRCNLFVLLITLGIYLYLAEGNQFGSQFYELDFPFAPEGNESLQQASKVSDFLVRGFSRSKTKVIIMAKDAEKRTAPSLLTLGSFAEMIEFERRFNEDVIDVDYDKDKKKERKRKYKDLCSRFDPKGKLKKGELKPCMVTPKPIDFVYDAQTDSYDLSGFETDVDLIIHIRKGLTEKELYRHDSDVLQVDDIFSPIQPEHFYQNLVTGANNIESAIAAKYMYYMGRKSVFDDGVMDLMYDFNEKSEHIEIGIEQRWDTIRDLQPVLQEDTKLAVYAAYIIVTYTIIFLGSCSPIHCRGIATITGILCVLLSVMAGDGLGFLLEYKATEINVALPLLMMGIGVDDMFVICNALDQTPLSHPPAQRLKQAMKHAGPSITITSLTNALAFLAGSSSTVPAIRSFCVFSSLTIMLLYISIMTIFLTVIYLDTVRVAKKWGELCGLCFCKEDSILFCRGRFLSKPQQIYSGIKKSKPQAPQQRPQANAGRSNAHKTTTQQDPSARRMRDSIPANPAPQQEPSTLRRLRQNYSVNSSTNRPRPSQEATTVVASVTEKFLERRIAPELISRRGQVSVLFIFTLLTILSLYGLSQMQIYYSSSLIKNQYFRQHEYLQGESEYFGEVYEPVIYVKLNGTTNFWEPEAQLQQVVYNEAIQKCVNCTQPWFKPDSFDSWFVRFRDWVDEGKCKYQRKGIDPFTKVMSAKNFKRCYDIWRKNDFIGKTYHKEVNYKDGKLKGHVQQIKTIDIQDPGNAAIAYLEDTRYIDQTKGLNETFSFELLYGNLEIYSVLITETLTTLTLSVTMVILVVLFITGNVRLTAIIVFVVLLVVLYMLATVNLWGLTLNHIVAVNVSFAFGIALDYSSHIATTYLSVKPPNSCKTTSQKRQYKARKAVSMMGSAVFHGGFSTLIAIATLGYAKMYAFIVFYKTWMCIIIYGLLNGIILLPVLLSLIGPIDLDEAEEKQAEAPKAQQAAIQMTAPQERAKAVKRSVKPREGMRRSAGSVIDPAIISQIKSART